MNDIKSSVYAQKVELLCEYRGKQGKIEVNQTKRGIVGGQVLTIPLSEKQWKISLQE